ncbi:hypothetical protein [Actinomadura yumaensis]|uniref:Uncharacterized protein n=1 Tax=Actinomadura yumaensis TaxID=111807 RepID=A0ABW2CGF2_9ACTN
MIGPAYVLRSDARVSPDPVPPALVALVSDIQRVAWPLWTEPASRTRREVGELCRLQTARGLTVLSWLALGNDPRAPARGTNRTGGEQEAAPAGARGLEWLLAGNRLAGTRQDRMYEAATTLPRPVRELVVANWTWALGTPHGGQVTAAFLAGGAYPEDGYSAAHTTVALLRLWERRTEARPPLAAAWAAMRTAADWCKAAELRASYGTQAPVFGYPRVSLPPRTVVRPWIARLLGIDTGGER